MSDVTVIAGASGELPEKPRKGFAAMSSEKRREVQQKSVATRLANRAKAQAVAAPAAPPDGAPPDPPPNYGHIPESGQGGAIDPSTRNVAGLGGRALSRPLAPDVVGLEPAPPHTRPAREGDVPFHAERSPHRAASPPGPGAAPPRVAPVLAQGVVLVLPDWETVELQEGQDTLDAAYKLLEQGAKMLQQRISAREVDMGYTCVQCGTPVPDLRNAKMIQARRDPVTGLIVNDVWCSARCYTAGISGGSFKPAAAR